VRGRAKVWIDETAGALGDLPTLLPLALGLAAVNGMDPGALFLSAGAACIGAGLYYRLPVPVQPLKALSAAAIATAASPATVRAAALLMGAAFAAVALFRLEGPIGKLFPRPVVRGIQLGLGVLLVKAGVKALFHASAAPAAVQGAPGWLVGACLGGAATLIILLSRESARYPATLVVFPFGVVAGGVLGWSRPFFSLDPGGLALGIAPPSGADLYAAAVVLVLPQVPLTFANSVVATADAARCYYGDRAARVTPRALAMTIGAGNLVAGSIGGLPMCHGSGGMTAHHRFGARTGRAPVILGSALVAAALLFGKQLPALCRLVPLPVLGAMLVYVGIQHARLARDLLAEGRGAAVAGVMGLVAALTGNLAWAFGFGTLLMALLRRRAGLLPGGG